MDTLNRDDVERLYEPYWADGRTPLFECGDGWLGILADLEQKFETLNEPVRVVQVKEKFGRLTVRTKRFTPQIAGWVGAAEAASEFTCEVCGNPGALGARNYWWSTRCDTCKPEGWEVAEEGEDVEAALANWVPGGE